MAVSYLEIHNESLYDLLAESPGTSSEGLAILDETAAGGGGCNVRSVEPLRVVARGKQAPCGPLLPLNPTPAGSLRVVGFASLPLTAWQALPFGLPFSDPPCFGPHSPLWGCTPKNPDRCAA